MQNNNGMSESLVYKPNIKKILQKSSAKTVKARGNFPVIPRKEIFFAQKSEAAISLK
jgi:hypothetical protein